MKADLEKVWYLACLEILYIVALGLCSFYLIYTSSCQRRFWIPLPPHHSRQLDSIRRYNKEQTVEARSKEAESYVHLLADKISTIKSSPRHTYAPSFRQKGQTILNRLLVAITLYSILISNLPISISSITVLTSIRVILGSQTIKASRTVCSISFRVVELILSNTKSLIPQPKSGFIILSPLDVLSMIQMASLISCSYLEISKVEREPTLTGNFHPTPRNSLEDESNLSSLVFLGVLNIVCEKLQQIFSVDMNICAYIRHRVCYIQCIKILNIHLSEKLFQ